jgi:hypothetical protein
VAGADYLLVAQRPFHAGARLVHPLAIEVVVIGRPHAQRGSLNGRGAWAAARPAKMAVCENQAVCLTYYCRGWN